MEPSAEPFGLVFDPAEVEQALDLPSDAVTVDLSTFGAGILADTLSRPHDSRPLSTSSPPATPDPARSSTPRA